MHRFTRLAASMVACFGLTHLAAAQVNLAPDHQRFTLDQITTSSTQQLVLPQQAGQPFRTIVELGDAQVTLDLEPHSVRGESFKVFVNGSGAREQLAELPAPRTYRGTVDGANGSVVAGSLIEGQLHASVSLDGDFVWVIEPMTKYVPDANPIDHIIYRSSDVIEREGVCGFDDDIHEGHDHALAAAHAPGLEVLKIAELAVDTDFEFYTSRGSNNNTVISDIENVINQVNVIYERDIELLFEIVHIEIRSSSNDPYTSSNAQTFLNQLSNHWRFQMGSIHRDLVQLFSGKNLDGSTIGIAWRPGVCTTTSSYSLIQNPGLSQTARVAVSAHEFGHNFNAPHCSGGGCRIMCAGLGGCSGIVTSFGSSSRLIITDYKDRLPCLGEPLPPRVELPFFEPFATQQIDEINWPELNAASTTTTVSNPPSSPRALALGIGGLARSISINVDPGLFPTKIYASFYAQQFGVEAGETLEAEYLDRLEVWQPLATVTSQGGTQGGFASYELELPLTAYGEDFQLRFTSNGNDPGDLWFIDNVSVSDLCLADVTGDGTLDIFDFLAFQDLFVNSEVLADVNGDGTLNIFDFLAYQDRFTTGCY